jgi:ribosomal protein S18 acetylase RimI-like enzyme
MYHEYYQMINEFRKTHFTYEQFIKTLAYINQYSEIWLLMEDNVIAATGTVIFEQKFIHDNSFLGHIEDICVKNKYQGKGYGKKIIDKLVEQAKEKGCYKVTLVCNENVKPFYEKCGLEIRGIQMSQLSELL